MPTRRLVLATGAAGAAIIGAGAFRLLHSDLSKARQPWREAGESFGDPRLDALAYAVLAPNPHNRQPWLVRLDGDDALTLFCDLDRLLPETDPPNRQIVIGLGAFLELLRQAAAQSGYRLEVTPFPEGEPQPVLDERPVATVKFIPDADVPADPLFGYALDRRTVRLPFDQKRPVSAETLNRLDAALRPGEGEFEWANDAANVDALKEICREGWLIEAGTARTHQESTALMRFGEHEINDNPDGISLSGPFMEATRAAGIMTRETMNDPNSRAYQGGLDFYNGLIDTAMAFGWLSTSGNSRTDQLNAGAGWMRLDLEQHSLAVDRPLAFVGAGQLFRARERVGFHWTVRLDATAGDDGDPIGSPLVHPSFRFGVSLLFPGGRDTDGDGVRDARDACDSTPPGVRVDRAGGSEDVRGRPVERQELRRVLPMPGVALEDVPVIGDSRRDLEAAVAIGARPILVRTGKGAATESTLDGVLANAEVFDNLSAAADRLIAEI